MRSKQERPGLFSTGMGRRLRHKTHLSELDLETLIAVLCDGKVRNAVLSPAQIGVPVLWRSNS